MRKRISLKDIAQKVGVSTALVSYVLNNRMEGRINKLVAQKIRETAAKLNYRPNQIAKSLKTNKTNTIGLIVADISNPFSSSLARIIEDEADKQGYTVIFGSSDENEKKSGKLIDTFMNRRVDGLIVCPPADAQQQIILLQKQGIPLVLVDRYFPEINANWVSLDNYTAAFEAVQHLLDSGRKRIGMIGYDSSLFNLKERERGYLSALEKSKIRDKGQWLKEVSINNEQAGIEAAVKSLLSLSKPVDALLFGSNRIAAGALRYINSLPVKIPGELALIGFDETEIFDFFHSPLTYVKQPLEEMGRKATTILLDNIEKHRKIQQISLVAELIIRDSTRR